MLTGIALFLLALVAILAVPVTLSYKLSWRQTLQGDIRLHWLFGLVRVRLPLSRSEKPAAQAESVSRQKRAAKSARSGTNPMAAIRYKPFRRRAIRFVRDCWHAIHKQDLKLRVRIGLGDPADTGQLWAVIGPVSAMLANIQQASIDIEAEFIEAVFELDSSGNIRLVPLQLIALTIGLLLSPPIWRGMSRMRRAG